MGAPFLLRQTFSAAVALLNRAAVKRYYTVRQQGDAFVIVVNDGDRVAQHTERFVAGAGAGQSGDAWHDALGNASVRVAVARWEGEALRTEVVYAATSAVAYEAEWRLEGERLRYTLSSGGGGASMWVLLLPATAGVGSPRATADDAGASWLGRDDVTNRQRFVRFLRSRGIPQPGNESDFHAARVRALRTAEPILFAPVCKSKLL
jgi:hypothetical protein